MSSGNSNITITVAIAECIRSKGLCEAVMGSIVRGDLLPLISTPKEYQDITDLCNRGVKIMDDLNRGTTYRVTPLVLMQLNEANAAFLECVRRLVGVVEMRPLTQDEAKRLLKTAGKIEGSLPTS